MDVTIYNKAKLRSEVGKCIEVFARFSTVSVELGPADVARDSRGLL